MRAEPPPPPRRDRQRSPARAAAPVRHRRCPYLEQILKERAGPFGMLTRYKADCHVDRRTHRFTGRHPLPPCIGEPETCKLYQSEHGAEDARIRRYED
ncbi:MAG: hypothetical protein JOZ46_12615 [Candidatus Dormibacteraeota bacterium]|nr:hypothetical protein [Candidatus Dormibacteraeota bacterium]MBV9526644.1 hypothetical protein [Candidatus Dormibacteraeota bacterium]